ncbi:MAG: regulatory protein RecX [Clostridia bacterium]|nr:regulatory protein RecX [Clostridia bacterium]
MVRIAELLVSGSQVTVILESGEKYWLRNEDLAGTGFYAGAEMPADSFYRWLRVRQYPRALNQAVAMLARRPCSKGEISSRLTRNRYASDVIELVLYKLQKEKLLDDRDFCNQWIQYRLNRGYGPAFIRRELRMKGVDEEIILSALESLDEEDGMEKAEALARKAWNRRKPDEDLQKSRQKVIGFLVRKGYSWDAAKAACKAAENNL